MQPSLDVQFLVLDPIFCLLACAVKLFMCSGMHSSLSVQTYPLMMDSGCKCSKRLTLKRATGRLRTDVMIERIRSLRNNLSTASTLHILDVIAVLISVSTQQDTPPEPDLPVLRLASFHMQPHTLGCRLLNPLFCGVLSCHPVGQMYQSTLLARTGALRSMCVSVYFRPLRLPSFPRISSALGCDE